ncbi:hypothetical protein JHS3_17010 [Jeongeupia sp. HS-3]|uniref:AAA family ATPase n=1 Tax=Jeongeupia sp. HS-3 TaxID=1009682 RepID=UPI0018A40A06|nr:ATP-binding protein [Jeongeupia sp. HS-3]BCL75965.1 hypothetical protein JHS3_17010 [Jeongeupia sp. HS-3]
MTRRIAIVGPESSGKTTLAHDLATALACPWVHEYVRDWFAGRESTAYTLADIVEIAAGQRALENRIAQGRRQIVCDTNALVCKIWAEVAYGHCPAEIEALWQPGDYALHLLVYPDVPWQPDPLREHPNDRGMLFDRYRAALDASGAPYLVMRGSHDARIAGALAAIAAQG